MGKHGFSNVDHEMLHQIRLHNPKTLQSGDFHVIKQMMGRNPSIRGSQDDAHGQCMVTRLYSAVLTNASQYQRNTLFLTMRRKVQSLWPPTASR